MSVRRQAAAQGTSSAWLAGCSYCSWGVRLLSATSGSCHCHWQCSSWLVRGTAAACKSFAVVVLCVSRRALCACSSWQSSSASVVTAWSGAAASAKAYDFRLAGSRALLERRAGGPAGCCARSPPPCVSVSSSFLMIITGVRCIGRGSASCGSHTAGTTASCTVPEYPSTDTRLLL